MAQLFGVWDWVVFGALLLLSVLIGVYYGVKSRLNKESDTTGEYLMGGRKLNLLPVSISILVSYMSAITLLGAPAEMYTAGTLYFMYTLGLIIACIISATVFVPLFYPLQLTSCFEYIELRFQSKAAKLTGTFIAIIQQLIYLGIASFAPSTALEAVSGIPTWVTIIAVGCVATFYTSLGGIKAVVWTDFFQAIVMLAGLLAIVIQGFSKVGSFSEVWSINDDWGRIVFWDGNPNPAVRHSIWSLVIGGAVLWTGAFGLGQPSVQRFCAVSTIQKAKISVLLNIVGCLVLMLLTCLAGISMFAYYAKKGCDPVSARWINNANQLIPFFVLEVLGYPGVTGLFISCLFSGALSTMSSSLNALCAVVWEDLIKQCVSKKYSESAKAWFTRILVITFGAAGTGIGLLVKNLGGTVLQVSLSFVGASAGPQIGMFLLGMFFPWANAAGCIVGGILGLAFALWIGIGAYSLPVGGYALDFPTSNCSIPVSVINTTTLSPAALAPPVELTTLQEMYTVSYLWFPTIGMLTTIIVGLITSLITAPFSRKFDIDPKYLIPLCDRVCCCFPQSWRRPFRLGYNCKDPQEILEETTLEKEIGNNADNESKNGIPANDLVFSNGVSGLSYRRKQTPEKYAYSNTAYDVGLGEDNGIKDSYNGMVKMTNV